MRPKLDQVLVLAAVVGIAVGVVVLLSASAAPLGLGAVACGCSLLAFASLGVLAVAASWLVQSSRRATGLVLRASPVIALAAGGLALAAGAAGFGRMLAAWSGPWGWRSRRSLEATADPSRSVCWLL